MLLHEMLGQCTLTGTDSARELVRNVATTSTYEHKPRTNTIAKLRP
jgi:hypothetical protein